MVKGGRRELIWLCHMSYMDHWHESIAVISCDGGWEIIDQWAPAGPLPTQVGRTVKGWDRIGRAHASACNRVLDFMYAHLEGVCELIYDVTEAGLPDKYIIKDRRSNG